MRGTSSLFIVSVAGLLLTAAPSVRATPTAAGAKPPHATMNATANATAADYYDYEGEPKTLSARQRSIMTTYREVLVETHTTCH